MTILAWYMDDDVEGDQRLPHRTAEEVSAESLTEKYGVLSWTGINGVDDPRLADIKRERNYNYSDIISVCPDKLPNFEEKIRSFFREHIHYDEEIRFCVEGSGYFDIRDENDRWIRISVEAGDMIVLPEGIYHRFTCDSGDYIKANRLFVGEPVWTPYNRDEIDELRNESRQKYVQSFFNSVEPSKRVKIDLENNHEPETVFEFTSAPAEPIATVNEASVSDN